MYKTIKAAFTIFARATVKRILDDEEQDMIVFLANKCFKTLDAMDDPSSQDLERYFDNYFARIQLLLSEVQDESE